MTAMIPLVSRLGSDEQQEWLQVLRQVLPEVQIVPIEEINADQIPLCEVAIVANPDPAQLLTLPNLKWVHSLWAGVERMVTELVSPPFDIVRMIDPQLGEVMAEAVLAWTLYLHREMPEYARQQQQRQWHQRRYCPAQQRQIGVLGLGELGRKSAQQLQGNGFSVMGWSRSPKAIDGIPTFHGEEGLTELLKGSHILICLLPLTEATRGLINAERLSYLPAGAALINFARGPIVDTNDLINALDRGHLRHAVLDVFDQEPLPPESALWQHPNITVLPHISAPTNPDTAAAIVASNIRRYREHGEMPVTVDLSRGY